MLEPLAGAARLALSSLLLVALGCDGDPAEGTDASSPADAGSEPGADAATDAGPTTSGARPWLYVVNTNDDLTSFAAANTADGPVTPRTSQPLGAATGLFQPRAIAITTSGRLLVGRQNGGIIGWDSLASADGETPRDREVTDGSLSTVVAFGYDASADRLYVGVPMAASGVLVYDDVSGAAFDGALAPSRAFGPPDRAPHATSGSLRMSVDAFAFDATGALYVVDTSGANTNHSRVLVFDAPGTADGETTPARIFESDVWNGLADIAIDGAGNLLAVDDTGTIYVVPSVASATGSVTPQTIAVSPDRANLAGILVGADGTVYVSDRQNADLYVFDALVGGTGAPSRTIGGTPTGLRGPRHMFLVE